MEKAPAGLTAGDRAPNFVLPDAQGRLLMLYERVKGNPFVLFFCGPGGGESAGAELAAFAALQPAFAAEGIDLFIVAEGGPEHCAGLARTLPEGLPDAVLLLADPKGAITAGYRGAAGLGRGGTACLLLDGNQRLIDLRGDRPGQADWALGRLRAWRRPAEPLRIAAVAPVLVVPAVLDQTFRAALIERWETQGHDEGSVDSMADGVELRRVHQAMKKRRDHAIQDGDLLRRLAGLVGRRVAPELAKAFGFRGFRFDRFLVTCYAAERGDRFTRHRDNLSPSTADRRFALTLNLNDDYDGGELAFPEYGPHLYRPEAGGAILFSCSLLHEALPVRRGRRFTLLSFLRDPAGAKRDVPAGA